MKPHHASGLLLLLSTAALGCDSGDDGSDAETATTSGTTSGATSDPMTASGTSTTSTGPGTSTGVGTSSTGEPGSSGDSGSSGTGGSSSGTAGGSTGGGSVLCNEHGNVVEKCTEATYEYGVGYCEYAIAAGEDYSAECGEAWEALFSCVNGVDCRDFGIVDVPGCESEQKKLNSLCP